MAWRPTKHLLEGELDNTTPGKVTGWMRFAGLNRKVTFDLKGNFHRDIRGAKIRFKGDGNHDDPEAAGYMDSFAEHQTGKVGDMTVGLPPADYVSGSPYLERSKSKGYHAWIFFDEAGVLASKARRVVKRILDEIGRSDTEVFPKQDRLDGWASYGNFINAPLFGTLVPKGRTVFLDPADVRKPFPNQWDFLESTQRVTEATLDEIIELNQLAQQTTHQERETCSTPTAGMSSFGLPPCARRMMAEGVTVNQRVACFRLAVHLRKAGLPLDAALAAMTMWAPKNRPLRGKGIITPREIIEQTTSAYRQNYRGCGCEDPAVRPYCDPGCTLLQKRRRTPPGGGRPAQNEPSEEKQAVSERAEKEPQAS